jgi:hypothetical protein
MNVNANKFCLCLDLFNFTAQLCRIMLPTIISYDRKYATYISKFYARLVSPCLFFRHINNIPHCSLFIFKTNHVDVRPASPIGALKQKQSRKYTNIILIYTYLRFALYPRKDNRGIFETPAFYQNALVIRNTTYEILNPLVAFHNIHGRNGVALFFSSNLNTRRGK